MVVKKHKKAVKHRVHASIPLKTDASDVASAISGLETAASDLGCGTVAYNLNVVAKRLAREYKSHTA